MVEKKNAQCLFQLETPRGSSLDKAKGFGSKTQNFNMQPTLINWEARKVSVINTLNSKYSYGEPAVQSQKESIRFMCMFMPQSLYGTLMWQVFSYHLSSHRFFKRGGKKKNRHNHTTPTKQSETLLFLTIGNYIRT